MNVLVTGGSGIVGTIVLPTLLQEHRATVFDLLPPRDPGIPHLAGSVTDHLDGVLSVFRFCFTDGVGGCAEKEGSEEFDQRAGTGTRPYIFIIFNQT